MTNGTTFREALMQLRLTEETDTQHRYRELQSQLSAIRVKISSIEESIARCSRQAQIAFHNGNDTVSRGNEREVQGLTLLRARLVGDLAGVKGELFTARQEWLDATDRRKTLDAELRVMKAVQETMQTQTA